MSTEDPQKKIDSTISIYDTPERFRHDRKDEALKQKNFVQAEEALSLINPPLTKEASIVDFPCGPGHHTDYFWEKGFKNITAMDGSFSHVQGLQNDPKYSDFPNVPTFKQALYQELDDEEKTVPDESQNAFFCFGESWGFLPTLEENEKHLKKMYDKLKAGGTLIIQGRYTPSFYQGNYNPSANLLPGDVYIDSDDTHHYSYEDGPDIENYIPEEFAPDLEDFFRELPVFHSGRPDKNGNIIPFKSASYLMPKLNAKGVPIDYPVIRAFCTRLGILDVKFHTKESIHPDGKPYYICSTVIKKPSKLAIDQTVEDTRDQIETTRKFK